MSKLKALIFDVDGTLADTEKYGHRLAFNRAFAEAGLNWDWSVELYGELLSVTGGKERINLYLQQYNRDFQVPSDNFIADLHKTKTKHYQDLLAEGAIPLRPGVKRLITEAYSQGVRLAIATTSALPNAIALLDKFLNLSWFEVIAAGDIVPAKKPAPDIYHYVLEQMNLDPENCLVLEDSQHGLQASSDAGLQTIITINEYTQNQNFADALLVLDHLGEPENFCNIIAGKVKNFNYLNMATIYSLHGQN